jgi:uncharacterized protein
MARARCRAAVRLGSGLKENAVLGSASASGVNSVGQTAHVAFCGKYDTQNEDSVHPSASTMGTPQTLSPRTLACMRVQGCKAATLGGERVLYGLRMLGGDSPAGDLFETLLPVAIAHWTNRGSKIHGPEHWRRVAENGLQLVVETPGADAQVVQAFAAFHDSQRRTDGGDPDHGARAAALARSLGLQLDDDQLELLCMALIEHDRGLVSDDPTIGAAWDSDRLDLVRLGKQPRAELMSTDAGKRQAAGAPL